MVVGIFNAYMLLKPSLNDVNTINKGWLYAIKSIELL